MELKILDPRITAKLLEGHKDILTPMAEERERFYSEQICPSCTGEHLRKTGDSRSLFRSGKPLPQYWLECESCGCVHDPHSGMIVTMGNVAKAVEPAVPILDGPDD